MSVTVGEAKVKLSFEYPKPDTKQIQESGDKAGMTFTRSFGERLKDAATFQAVQKVFDGAVNLAKKAGSAIADTIKSSINSFADYEQLTGGVETLFKDSASIVQDYAANAYRTAGMSANQYMEQITGFSASLLQSLGGDTEKAAKIGDMAVSDMADNANKMGTSMEAIQYAYQGFAKQNYTMLDNLKLGYGGTKQEMERLLADAEKLTGIHYDISNLSDVYNAIHAIQGELGITGTTAQEAATTVSGSIGSMQGAWQNLLTGLTDGTQDMGGLIDNLVGSVETVAGNLMPVVEQALRGIVKLAQSLLPKLVDVVDDLLPDLIDGVVKMVDGLIQQLPTIINTILPPLLNGVVQLLQSLIITLANSLPMLTQTIITGLVQVIHSLSSILPTLVSAITTGIIEVAKVLTDPTNLAMILNAGIELLMALVDAIPDVIVAVIDALPEIIENIVSFLTNPDNIMKIVGAAVKLFMGLVQAVPQILGALFGAFGKLFGDLWNSVTGLFGEFAGNFGNFIGNIFKGAVNGVIGFIENFINLPINAVNGFLDVINAIIGAVGGHIDYIETIRLPRLAKGGVVEATQGGQVIVAGEAGEDEWVVPESKMASLFRQIDEEMEHRGSGEGKIVNVYMNNQISSELDINEVCRSMTEVIRRAA